MSQNSPRRDAARVHTITNVLSVVIATPGAYFSWEGYRFLLPSFSAGMLAFLTFALQIGIWYLIRFAACNREFLRLRGYILHSVGVGFVVLIIVMSSSFAALGMIHGPGRAQELQEKVQTSMRVRDELAPAITAHTQVAQLMMSGSKKVGRLEEAERRVGAVCSGKRGPGPAAARLADTSVALRDGATQSTANLRAAEAQLTVVDTSISEMRHIAATVDISDTAAVKRASAAFSTHAGIVRTNLVGVSNGLRSIPTLVSAVELGAEIIATEAPQVGTTKRARNAQERHRRCMAALGATLDAVIKPLRTKTATLDLRHEIPTLTLQTDLDVAVSSLIKLGPVAAAVLAADVLAPMILLAFVWAFASLIPGTDTQDERSRPSGRARVAPAPAAATTKSDDRLREMLHAARLATAPAAAPAGSAS